jgi:hypothetical protein
LRINDEFPSIIIDMMTKHQQTIFLSDLEVRELQEHYLSTKGWRNDNESTLSRILADEIDRDRQKRIYNRFIRPRSDFTAA